MEKNKEPLRYLELTEGEILKILIERDERRPDDIAKEMGYNGYTYLPKLYSRMTLNEKQKQAACDVLNVHMEVFDVRTVAELRELIELNRKRIFDLQTKLTELALELDECRAKNAKLKLN
jgi:hypothetical protein